MTVKTSPQTKRRNLLAMSAMIATVPLALASCSVASGLSADAKAFFAEAATVGSDLASLVKNDASVGIAALAGLPSGDAVATFQGVLGIAEVAAKTLLSASPLYLAIEAAISGAVVVAKDVSGLISNGAEVGSSAVQTGLTTLVAKTAALQVAVQNAQVDFTGTKAAPPASTGSSAVPATGG